MPSHTCDRGAVLQSQNREDHVDVFKSEASALPPTSFRKPESLVLSQDSQPCVPLARRLLISPRWPTGEPIPQME